MLAWIVGGGGQLGSALVRRAQRDHAGVFAATTVPWADDAIAARTLVDDLGRFRAEAGDEPWVLAWAAGTSIVGSNAEQTTSELHVLESLLAALAAGPPSGPGAVLLASSAGGLFAGSSPAPFGDDTIPVPISPYGELKLRQETAAAESLAGRVPLVIARLANLYGPQFDARKGQGLVQQLCLSALRRRPLNLYVSMDTVRDYIYVDDAADLCWSAAVDATVAQPADPVVAIVASGQPTTVSRVIATVEDVTHRRVPIALGTHPSSRHQVIDLRLIPSTAALGGRRAATPLAAGIKRVVDALAGQVAT